VISRAQRHLTTQLLHGWGDGPMPVIMLFRAPPKIPAAQNAKSTSMSASSVRLVTSLTARVYSDRCHVKPL
jgi:hypothetical protein